MQRRKSPAGILLLIGMLAAAGCAIWFFRPQLAHAAEYVRYLFLGDRVGYWEEEAGKAGWGDPPEEYYYQHLSDEKKETYRELYVRLMRYEDEASLFSRISTDDFWAVYYAVLNDHPEIFWTGPSVQVSESALTGNVIRYEAETTVPPERRDEMRQRLDLAAGECEKWLWPEATDYEKIRTVYEYLIDLVEYDQEAPDSQNAQSALLYHRSVCAGYSRAFQFILHRLGLFCTYLTGKTVRGGDHGWNLVRIDGKYYYVDVTWGDPVFAGREDPQADAAAQMGMNYNYLCCTSEELFRTHIPSDDVDLPVCDSDDYNYYRLNGLYYETFDWDTIYSRLMNSVWNSEDSVVMKFGSGEAYEQARQALFQDGMLQDAAEYLMDVHQVRTWNYRYCLEQDFRVITICWN